MRVQQRCNLRYVAPTGIDPVTFRFSVAESATTFRCFWSVGESRGAVAGTRTRVSARTHATRRTNASYRRSNRVRWWWLHERDSRRSHGANREEHAARIMDHALNESGDRAASILRFIDGMPEDDLRMLRQHLLKEGEQQ